LTDRADAGRKGFQNKEDKGEGKNGKRNDKPGEQKRDDVFMRQFMKRTAGERYRK